MVSVNGMCIHDEHFTFLQTKSTTQLLSTRACYLAQSSLSPRWRTLGTLLWLWFMYLALASLDLLELVHELVYSGEKTLLSLGVRPLVQALCSAYVLWFLVGCWEGRWVLPSTLAKWHIRYPILQREDLWLPLFVFTFTIMGHFLLVPGDLICEVRG